jgi:hypothetical protein
MDSRAVREMRRELTIPETISFSCELHMCFGSESISSDFSSGQSETLLFKRIQLNHGWCMELF